MTSPFDFSGPSKLVKSLLTSQRVSAAATKNTARLRGLKIDPTQIYGLSHKADERAAEFIKRRKKK